MANIPEYVQIELSVTFKKGAMANTIFLYKSDHTVSEQQYNSKPQEHSIGNCMATEEILQWRDAGHNYCMRESVMTLYWKALIWKCRCDWIQLANQYLIFSYIFVVHNCLLNKKK